MALQNNAEYHNVTNTTEYTYNWVYIQGGDKIACAPGYVDMPLFCTTFVYAGINPTLPREKLGIPQLMVEILYGN